MPLSERENYLRNARFEGPEWMPCTVVISGATWNQLREELEEVCARHPTIFPGFERGRQDFSKLVFANAYRANETFTDNWGCVWESAIDGIEGIVKEHPLADWSALETWSPPDPMTQGDRGPVDWPRQLEEVRKAKAGGHLTRGGLPHGYLFMRLYYLRGFENLMLDIATEEPRLQRLIDLLVDHNRVIVNQWLSAGVDVVEFAEDLGTQKASCIGPKYFAKWLTPAYRKLMQPVKESQALVALHSDGYIMDLMDELLVAGVDIINPQDLCNGIDNLAREVKGRACIRLDIDRQQVVPFGTRNDIRELIAEEVRKLGSPQGGLEMIAGIYPPTPAENVDALCEALEEFRTYWWDGRGN
ncbi:MAG: uroporphyrinogen decarboxylase family protein [Candidatus Zipacnadales bacterium]